MLAKILPNNEGGVDRILRVLFGSFLLALVFVGPQTLWGLIGAVPLLTGLLGSCPVSFWDPDYPSPLEFWRPRETVEFTLASDEIDVTIFREWVIASLSSR